MKTIFRASVRTLASILGAAALLLAAGPAAANEATALVPIKIIAVFSNGTTQTYYLQSDRPWGFANCSATVNSGWLTISTADSAAKQWLSVLLTAKATGASVQLTVDNCTTLNVIQVQIQ